MTKPTIESKCEKTRCASVDSVNKVASTRSETFERIVR